MYYVNIRFRNLSNLFSSTIQSSPKMFVNVRSLLRLTRIGQSAPVLFPGLREVHSFKNSAPSKPSFLSKFLPSQKLRKNAERKNLPAVAVVKLQGIISDQVHI